MRWSLERVLGCLVICAYGFSAAPVLANESASFADLRLPPRESRNTILGLSFPEPQAGVRVEEEGTPNQKIIAILKGVFSREDWSLIVVDQGFLAHSKRTEATAPFSIKIPLTGVETAVHLSAIDPHGHVQDETVVIVYPQFLSGSQGATEIPSLGKILTVGLGVTSISYSQTGFPDLSEIVLTPKITYQQPLKGAWDAGGSLYMTALPLHSDQNNMTAYFLGVNARIGYTLPMIPKPWTLSVAVGAYYTTMFTSGIGFGFRDLWGPQIFPVLRRDLTHGNIVSACFKYSPVTSGSSVGFSNHELAAAVSYIHLLPNLRSISGTLDYSNIQIRLPTGNASDSSITLGAAYGL